MRRKYRLIRAFVHGLERYKTYATCEMTDYEAYLSNKILIDPRMVWVS